jgi:hypothetical protein
MSSPFRPSPDPDAAEVAAEGALTKVLACTDGSAYDDSVCDHAAWLAGPFGASVEVLRAVDKGAPASPHAGRRACERLAEHGVNCTGAVSVVGPFVEAACSAGADIIVMGKRGHGDAVDRRALGSKVAPMVDRWAGPLCLASQVFLSIHSALVLIDADPGHAAATDLVADHPSLRDLRLSLVVVSPDAAAAGRKMDWVRQRLAGRSAAISHIAATGLEDALARYMASGAADLFVISRAVLFPDPDTRLRRLAGSGLWAWRTPVLIC